MKLISKLVSYPRILGRRDLGQFGRLTWEVWKAGGKAQKQGDIKFLLWTKGPSVLSETSVPTWAWGAGAVGERAGHLNWVWGAGS